MSKRIMAAGIILLMLTGMLAGCNSKPVEVTKESQSINLESVDNARQVGGYAGASNKRIKDGMLLRTGALVNASEADIKLLEDTYKVAKVIDLRKVMEVENEPDPNLKNAANVHVSILEDAQKEDGDEEAGLASAVVAAYAEDPVQAIIDLAIAGEAKMMFVYMVVNEESQQGFANFFREIINTENGAVLWHCTGGKDRAGLASVFLLSALGVDRETIMKDFLLSNDFYSERIEKMGYAASAKGCTEEQVQMVKDLVGVSEEYMNMALDTIDQKYGSMDDYLKNQLKLTDADIKTLRSRYLK